MGSMQNWLYESTSINDDEDLNSYVGFVYMIQNLVDGRRYIGKKLFKFSRTKQVKGKRKRFKIESDWKTYFSSSEALKADVERLGPDSFRREILRLCKTKAECSYWEAKLQFEHDVLLSDEWYNSWISCKIHKGHVKGKGLDNGKEFKEDPS